MTAASPSPANRFLAALRACRTRPLVVAHRGDSRHMPENTIEAALRAWQVGADAWELDVRLTRDGAPVVLHDESLLRTTDVLRRFPGDPRGASGCLASDFDHDEIRSLDAGSWFLGPAGGHRTAEFFGTRGELDGSDVALIASGSVRIPSLRECLDLTVKHQWLVNVELKSFPDPDPRLLDAVAAEVRDAGACDRVLLSSFDHGVVALASGLGDPVATGVLTETPLHLPGRYVKEVVGADCFHTSALALGSGAAGYLRRPAPERLRQSDLVNLAAHNVPTLVYTVNDHRGDGLAAHLRAWGAAGIFTDDPAGLLELYSRTPG